MQVKRGEAPVQCDVCGKEVPPFKRAHDCDGGEALRKAASELFAPTIPLLEKVIEKAGTGILRGVFEVVYERDRLKARVEELESKAAPLLSPSQQGENDDVRRLVDLVWQTATDSSEVPSHRWADELLARWRGGQRPAVSRETTPEQPNRADLSWPERPRPTKEQISKLLHLLFHVLEDTDEDEASEDLKGLLEVAGEDGIHLMSHDDVRDIAELLFEPYQSART